MPKKLFDASEVDVRCPHCGHKNPKTVARLRTERQFACAGCSANVVIEMEQFRRAIEAADEAMEEFQSILGNLVGKRS